MWGILLNILSEAILVSIVAAYVVFTNRAELLKKLGYKNTYMDIPYDPETNLILVVKAHIPDYKEGIYVLPQTAKTGIYQEDASLTNAEELGLSRNLYHPKVPLKYTGKSNRAKKSYLVCYVRVSKSAMVQAANERDIPWTYDEEKDMFVVRSIKYEEAMFTTPERALEILVNNVHLGPRPNNEKADVYLKSFSMLGKLFKLDTADQA
ncbi:MAG: hypothetical protein RLY61_759 [Candidatus Parcubacteria bacterium]